MDCLIFAFHFTIARKIRKDITSMVYVTSFCNSGGINWSKCLKYMFKVRKRFCMPFYNLEIQPRLRCVFVLGRACQMDQQIK